jgi:hypothetical protein
VSVRTLRSERRKERKYGREGKELKAEEVEDEERGEEEGGRAKGDKKVTVFSGRFHKCVVPQTITPQELAFFRMTFI